MLHCLGIHAVNAVDKSVYCWPVYSLVSSAGGVLVAVGPAVVAVGMGFACVGGASGPGAGSTSSVMDVSI